MTRTINRGSGAGADSRNLLEDREPLLTQSTLGSMSCNRASQEDARIVASVRQLLDVRVGRFHACRAQQEAHHALL